MADEREIGIAVMRIAAANSGLCTFERAYQEVPQHVVLSPDNLAPSLTRAGELMWQQLVRNIKSHDTTSGNLIAEGYLEHVPGVGYRLTNAGEAYLSRY